MSIITLPHTHATGDDVLASEENANNQTIYNDYNGNVTNLNVAANAAIAGSKLADNGIELEKINLRNYIGGLRTENGTDSDHDIDINVGQCRDSTNVESLTLGTKIVKRLDAGFAVGTGNGGLDTGAIAASTLYAVHLIKRTDTNVVDALFSLSFTSPTLPTNYGVFRLIGFVVTNSSSNIIGFFQQGDYFRFTGDIIQDIGDATITSNTFEIGTLSVPPLSLAHVYVNLVNTTSTDASGQVYLRQNGTNDAPSTEEAWLDVAMGGSTFDQINTQGFVFVDDSSQVQYAAVEASGSAAVEVRTIGCIMYTRSEP